MGQIANILDGSFLRPSRLAPARLPARPYSDESCLVRLIPGTLNRFSRNHKLTAQTGEESFSQSESFRTVGAIAAEFLPRPLGRILPDRLGMAVLDLAIITSVMVLESRSLSLGERPSPFKALIFCLYLLVFVLFAAGEELYGERCRDLKAEYIASGKSIAWTTLFVGLTLQHFSPQSILPLLALSVVSLLMMSLARRCWRTVLCVSGHCQNVLIVGSGSSARRAAEAIRSDNRADRSVRQVLSEGEFRNLCASGDLSRLAREEFIDELIIASQSADVSTAAIREAHHHHLDVALIPELPATAKANPINIAGMLVIRVHEEHFPRIALSAKRILDVLLSAISLAALLPLLFIVVALIRLDSPGPALYRSVRIGRKGRRFTCHKFRTMAANADALKDHLRQHNERRGAFFKITNDPRLTRVGRFLRRYSLDELPQLWNVLLGDMSLVGPRPHPPDDVKRYGIQHLQRLDFVPGITGLWQVTARRDPSFERSVALDVEYIRSWTFWLDLHILWRTFSAVLQGSGT